MAMKSILTREEEQALGRMARAGDVAVRNELVERNQPYVNRFVRRYAMMCTTNDLKDMRQEAMIGLLEAAKRYDPDRFDCKFLTIASHYVKKQICIYLSERSLVHVPLYMHASHPVTKAKTGRSKARFDTAATAAEIAKRRPLYLGAYPQDGDEIIGAEPEHDSLNFEQLESAIAKLPPLEREVIRGRFGVGSPKETGKAMAARFRCHPQKIVNIKHAAIAKLRHLMMEAGRD